MYRVGQKLVFKKSYCLSFPEFWNKKGVYLITAVNKNIFTVKCIKHPEKNCEKLNTVDLSVNRYDEFDKEIFDIFRGNMFRCYCKGKCMCFLKENIKCE